MTEINLQVYIIIGLSAAALLILSYQIKRAWKLRYLLKKFLEELKKLNENINNVVTFIHGKSLRFDAAMNTKEICGNCIFRETFLMEETVDIFSYQCKLDKRVITLSDSCKRYKKDLQDTNIK